MKIVIQNRKNRTFYQAPKTWTPDPDRALDFGKTSAAVQFCHSHRLPTCRVMLSLDSGKRYDIGLRVGAREMPGPALEPEMHRID